MTLGLSADVASFAGAASFAAGELEPAFAVAAVASVERAAASDTAVVFAGATCSAGLAA